MKEVDVNTKTCNIRKQAGRANWCAATTPRKELKFNPPSHPITHRAQTSKQKTEESQTDDKRKEKEIKAN